MTTVIGTKTGPRSFKLALESASGSGGALRAIGAASALAARVGVEAGFDALWVSGLEVSAALGLPDENVIGSRDLADVVAVLRRASGLPIIVDIDNAGGSPATARRVACDLTRAGAAALCLEDSAYPKVNSFSTHRDQLLADPELVREQLAAIRESGPSTVIIARTEALICGTGIPEAHGRAARYAAAGADALLIHSKDPSGEQALCSASAWTGDTPLVTVPTAFPHLDDARLAAAGYGLAIYANQLSRASLAAMRAAAAAFTASGSFTAPGCPPLADVQDLLRIGNPDARASL